MSREDTQFKEGQSGNPSGLKKDGTGGRPPGKSLRTILDDLGDGKGCELQDDTIIDKGTGEVIRQLNKYETLALTLYSIAEKAKNDADKIKAILSIRDIVEGKLTDKVEVKEEYVYPPEDDVIFERYNQQEFEQRFMAASDEDFNALYEKRKQRRKERENE